MFLLENVSYSETLMKMNKDVSARMVLDYKESFDSTLPVINDELK